MARTQRLTAEETQGRAAPELRTWLVRLGMAASPLTAPAIFPLDHSERLTIGREMTGEGRDPWMSAAHAEVARGPEGWILRDLGSSNGTCIWGERRSQAALSDGDVFETGGTFWLFRREALIDPLPEAPFTGPLCTLSPPFAARVAKADRVARTRVPMMLLGATGTGKEVIARAIHAKSGRNGPFVAINTAAIQPTLVASELFGVEKGAHSTAEASRPGQVRAAQGGTLLLDEIGDMPLEVQVALLRMLQESEIVPVGGDRPVKVDVRVICATHQNLEAMIDAGRFRADLFARLNGCRIEVPDLADRVEDIGLLIARMMRRFAADDMTFSPAAYRALVAYPWPQNVRELEKGIETALALAEGDRIEVRDLPDRVANYTPERASETPVSGPELEDQYGREIVRLLQATGGNVTAVARTMGRSRMQIHRWLKRLDIDPERYR